MRGRYEKLKTGKVGQEGRREGTNVQYRIHYVKPTKLLTTPNMILNTRMKMRKNKSMGAINA